MMKVYAEGGSDASKAGKKAGAKVAAGRGLTRAAAAPTRER